MKSESVRRKSQISFNSVTVNRNQMKKTASTRETDMPVNSLTHSLSVKEHPVQESGTEKMTEVVDPVLLCECLSSAQTNL